MDVAQIVALSTSVVILITIVIGIKKLVEAHNANKLELSEQIGEHISNLRKDINKQTEDILSIKNLMEIQSDYIKKEVNNSLIKSEDNIIKALKIESKTTIHSQSNHFEKLFEDLSSDTKSNLADTNLKLQTAINGEIKKVLDSNSKGLESLNILNSKVQSNTHSFEKYQIDNKNQLENSFQNTVRLVNNLRLDNLINVSNEIGKYKNGIVEDEYFLQEVGSCKVIKFTDKQSKEVTEVYYNELGEKSHTQTFLEDNLKYEMKYLSGLLSQGVEYDKQNQVIFAYEYNEAGEVSTKIEYEYDKSGKQTEKSKIKY
ncbi:MAG: hypothetical protein U9N59_14785 [Campylobacterota bacterium]|nr:hypothetical protein [Campylobacterota bacterium]